MSSENQEQETFEKIFDSDEVCIITLTCCSRNYSAVHWALDDNTLKSRRSTIIKSCLYNKCHMQAAKNLACDYKSLRDISTFLSTSNTTTSNYRNSYIDVQCPSTLSDLKTARRLQSTTIKTNARRLDLYQLLPLKEYNFSRRFEFLKQQNNINLIVTPRHQLDSSVLT